MLYSKDGDIMANDKLSEQSMDFAVQIINLVKQLKEQRESIISNQMAEAARRSARIFVKLNMHTVRRILFPKCRLPQRSKRNRILVRATL